MNGFIILSLSIIGVGVLVSLVISILTIIKRGILPGVFMLVISISIAILIFLVFFLVAAHLENDKDVIEVLDYQQTIYSIEDSQSQISLKYIIRNNNVYSFMVKNENGFYQRSISTNGTFINEINTNEVPTIYFYKTVHTKKFIKWFYGETYFKPGKVVINVPKGTISTEFNIDLK